MSLIQQLPYSSFFFHSTGLLRRGNLLFVRLFKDEGYLNQHIRGQESQRSSPQFLSQLKTLLFLMVREISECTQESEVGVKGSEQTGFDPKAGASDILS